MLSRLFADEVIVATAATATITTEPIMTTRFTVGDTVERAPASRRAVQTAAALLTTCIVVVVQTRLINSYALMQRIHLVTQDLHEFF